MVTALRASLVQVTGLLAELEQSSWLLSRSRAAVAKGLGARGSRWLGSKWKSHRRGFDDRSK